ncbi:hypothetical protein [Staphylococcus phage vB_SauM-V1SA20]|nr:hypothetical protein [Staphylococcus phage vB_SauM-V1SA20]
MLFEAVNIKGKQRLILTIFTFFSKNSACYLGKS